MNAERLPDVAIEQLGGKYGQELAQQLAGDPNVLPLPHYEGLDPNQSRSMEYYFVRAEDPKAPTALYVPGMLEGAVNKISTAAEFAQQGINFILPVQDRGPMLRDPTTNKIDATYTQAKNMLELLKVAYNGQNEGLEESEKRPVDVVAHSLGSIIVQEMVKIADREGLGYLFKEAQVFLLAPAGLRRWENYGRIAIGWAGMMMSESDPKRFMTYPDTHGLSSKESMVAFERNRSRTFAELGDLARRKVDVNYIADHVDSVSVLPYAQDKMFPSKDFRRAIKKSTRENIVWVSPVFNTPEHGFRGGDGSTHDAEQYIPELSRAVPQLMRQRAAVKAKRPFVDTPKAA